MEAELEQFLKKNLGSINHVRFELGDPFENGSDQRICQVNLRVKMIFNSIFDSEDSVYLWVKDWEHDDVMFGSSTPNYLYSLFDMSKANTETVFEKDEDELEEEFTMEYKVHSIPLKIKEIKWKKILSGIANNEQGRKPAIGQSVVFI